MGCFVHRKLYLLIFVVAIFVEQIGANQLEVAKKYGKRFGNKSRLNSTADGKDTDKSLTKAMATDIVKTSVRANPIETTTAPVISRQQRYSYSKIQTTTSSPTTGSPSTTVKTDDQEEVDVDLSQLQVSLPNVKFDCGSRSEGYYGDPDYRCEVFHYCSATGQRDTFLCPSNSKFNQKDMTCDTDAVENLCESEHAWGNNNLFPTQTVPNPSAIAHVSPIELNRAGTQDKVQIDVNPPNKNREPVSESKNNREDSKRAQSGDKQDNNQSKDNYNTEDNTNNDNKDMKFNFFGGTFGERQRTNGVPNAVLGSTSNANDPNPRKNANNHFKNNLLANDFGTVSDANKRGHKEENGNTNRATTGPRPQPPVVVTLSTSAVDSVQQSFPSNTYSYSKPVLNTNQDFRNNKNAFENNHKEKQMPSTAPDQSFLVPPPASTEPPSSVSPNVRVYSSVAQTPVHSNTRPKWQNHKQNPETPTPPPPQPSAPPRLHRPKPPRIEQETWPQQEQINIYEPVKSEPFQQIPDNRHIQEVNPPKHIQIENTEIIHPNWSPVGQLDSRPVDHKNHFKHNRPKTDFKPKKNVHKTWNNLDLQPQTQQTESYVQNKNKETVYTYPAMHHTIDPSPLVDNHLWSSDDKTTQEVEVDYRPAKESKNQFKVQHSGPPPRPKWAQDMINEMEVIPQGMTTFTQPLLSQSSHLQKTQNMKTEISRNRKPLKLATSENFESLPLFNGFEFNESDLFGSKRPTGTRQVTTNAGPLSLFYDQFKPYTFAENNPAEAVRKPFEDKPIDDQMMGVFRTKNKNQNYGTKSQQSQTPTLVDELRFDRDPYRMGNGRLTGYVPEMLTEEEYSAVMPETHTIPKLHKQKSKGHPKFNPNRYKNSKQPMISSPSYLEDMLAGAETNWAMNAAMKQFEGSTSGLEAAYSHHYPMLPSMSMAEHTRHTRKFPKYHPMSEQNRFIFGSPMATTGRLPSGPVPHPQQAFFIPPMPFMSPLQAQPTIPMPYYMPYVPTSQQTIRSDSSTKAKSNSKSKTSKSKSNSTPKIIRI